ILHLLLCSGPAPGCSRKNGESCLPPLVAIGSQAGCTTALLSPYLAHPRLTVLKPLRQVDAIAPRRGCPAVCSPISPANDRIGVPPPKAASLLACTGFSAAAPAGPP